MTPGPAKGGREGQLRVFKRILMRFAEWGHANGQCPCCLQPWPTPPVREQPVVIPRSVPRPDPRPARGR
jgi:hypothetical protein